VPRYHQTMSDEQSRTDATSRERSPDHQYTLTVEQTADLYAAAGQPRTIRAIQKYCAVTKLDCHKVETETGEKYLVAPYSVERHIAYINEVRTDATRALPGGFESGRIHKALGMGECVGFDSPLEGRGNAEVVF
jgi:hypothetical protein